MSVDGMNEEKSVSMFRKMLVIRKFEEKVSELFYKGSLPSSVHSYIGQEAVAVGVMENLYKSDFITSTHRGHGHIIAKGGDLRYIMAEIFGKKTGYCKGKGGTMHIADTDLNILGANGIVGGGLPIATGAALSLKLQGRDGVVVCFFGDGAANHGTFHESLNLAAVWKLPVVFICENNKYMEATPSEEITSVTDISVRAGSYNIPGILVDGMDVFEVQNNTKDSIERARIGGGPSLVECKTYRFREHNEGLETQIDGNYRDLKYRMQEEIDAWKQKDPIINFQKKLLDEKILTTTELDIIVNDITNEVEEAVIFAMKSPDPDPEDSLKDVYS